MISDRDVWEAAVPSNSDRPDSALLDGVKVQLYNPAGNTVTAH
jgi:hypothetical protein